jgi:hypothetical protein
MSRPNTTPMKTAVCTSGVIALREWPEPVVKVYVTP